MAEKSKMQQLFVDLKEAFRNEIKELRDNLKDFQQETERDIKTIMP